MGNSLKKPSALDIFLKKMTEKSIINLFGLKIHQTVKYIQRETKRCKQVKLIGFVKEFIETGYKIFIIIIPTSTSKSE